MKDRFIFYGWLAAWGTLCMVILFTAKGVGDSADGVMHYMFARYAHLHPDNFLDPWAKTGFTLLAWPFAQFGLQGVMLLNMLAAGGSMWLVYQMGKALQIKYAWSSSVILSLSTYYFVLIFSGLTEHVFSFVLILSIYLLIKNKWIMGTLVLSTLPFFRQEGYLMIASLIPFFLYKRKMRWIPLLGASFILVGVWGAVRYHQLMWIFQSNPYLHQASYGKGNWYDFFVHLYYTYGLVNLLFFITGVFFMIFCVAKKRTNEGLMLLLGIFLPFLGFFASHAIFWYLGAFHSMGLQRVLNGVAPLFAVIAGFGFSTFTSFISSKKLRSIFIGILVPIIIIYPFTPSPSSIHVSNIYALKPMELTIKEAMHFLNTQRRDGYIYAEHPLVPYFLAIDPFDKNRYGTILTMRNEVPKPGAIIIWESSFANLQGGLTEEEADTSFIKMAEYNSTDGKQKVVIYQVTTN